MSIAGSYNSRDYNSKDNPLRLAKDGIMKGMIFTEFLDMVSDAFSPEMVEKIIEASNLPSDGAYT